MDQTLVQPQGTYQPVAVAAVVPKNHGLAYGVGGIVCAIIAIPILPPVLGTVGIVLGILAIRKGEKALGITSIILSIVCIVLGMALGFYALKHPDFLKVPSKAASSAVIEAFLQ